MPWSIVPRGGKFAVVADDTGKVMGVHASRAKARQQQQALYANVHKLYAGVQRLFDVLRRLPKP
jgi:hypothetical protein